MVWGRVPLEVRVGRLVSKPLFRSLENFFDFSCFGLSEQGFSVIGRVHTGRMESWSETGLVNAQIDAWQEELVSVESEIGRLRYRQVVLIPGWTVSK